MAAQQSVHYFLCNGGGDPDQHADGYVFAKYEFKAKKPLFILLLATMMVPPQVTMIPRYLMIQKLGLFNTVWL